MAGPAGTIGDPKDEVAKLADAQRHGTSSKEIDERLRAEGSEPSSGTPEEFSAYIAREASQMAKLAVDLKLPKEWPSRPPFHQPELP